MKTAKPAAKDTDKILELAELTWKQIDALDRTKTVIFIPISPLEEHGPHLPSGTDLLTTIDATKEAMKLIHKKKPELQALLHPVIPLGHAQMTQGFPGTVTIPTKTIRTIVTDVISSFTRFNFRYFVVCTFHMDLGHLKGIYAAMNKVMKTPNVHVIEPWGPYFYSHEADKREPKADFDTHLEIHGCYRETSLMSYQYPWLVDPNYKNLPPFLFDVYSLKAVGRTLKDVGAKEGYIGSPAQATTDYGRWYFQEIVETLADATIDMMEGRPPKDLPPRTKLEMHSMFWL